MEQKAASGMQKKHLNEGLNLDKFDFKNMRGAMFNDYIDMVEGKVVDEDDPRELRGGGLPANRKYVFEVYDVEPIKKRLYPKSKTDVTTVPDGFNLKKDKPVAVTTTFLKGALLLNSMLYASIGGGEGLPILYYLLQKPPTNTLVPDTPDNDIEGKHVKKGGK